MNVFARLMWHNTMMSGGTAESDRAPRLHSTICISETLAPLCVRIKSVLLPPLPSPVISVWLRENISSLDLSPGSSGALNRTQRGERHAGQARLITEQQRGGFLRITDSCHSLNVVSACYRKMEGKKSALRIKLP